MENFLNDKENIVCNKNISNSIDFDKLIENIKNEMNVNKIQIVNVSNHISNIKFKKIKQQKNKQAQVKMSPNISNPNDKISWKFDYIYDWGNKGPKMHSIENNGKNLVCNCDNDTCRCFYIAFSFGMKPQSGKYKIRIKINDICNGGSANVIGIISQHSKNNTIRKTNQNNDNNKTLYWFNQLYDYIGWSASGRQDDKHLPNGLLCGWNDSSSKNNIFRNNNFVYSSNNEDYSDRLPVFKSGDIILLSYDSNNGILSFCKENDNGKLDAQISNLPKENTYYWFVGHHWRKMCLSVDIIAT